MNYADWKATQPTMSVNPESAFVAAQQHYQAEIKRAEGLLNEIRKSLNAKIEEQENRINELMEQHSRMDRLLQASERANAISDIGLL
jgi:hypothetical protein